MNGEFSSIVRCVLEAGDLWNFIKASMCISAARYTANICGLVYQTPIVNRRNLEILLSTHERKPVS